VKFLCDRCRTRYSIGDERVRGKILKIRCKSCANVITVREGMSADPEASGPVDPEHAGRAKKATTAAPAVLHEATEARRGPATAPAPAPAAARTPAPTRAAAREPAVERRPGAVERRPGAVERRPGAVERKPGAQAVRGASDDAAAAGKRAVGGELGRSDTASALNAAFASAMAKPPPALEEEWYVSIDGEQAGPFSLTEARRWVVDKPLDAELHCWSEGFDDWLPIDKVSHFRGLRKRSPPSPPQRPAVVAARVVPPPRVGAQLEDDEPKPMFAATMASLERNAPVASSPGLQLPGPNARATPPRGSPTPARSNGAASSAVASAARAARPTADPFEMSDAATQMEAPAFRDPILAPAAEPGKRATNHQLPGPQARSSDAAPTTPHLPAARTMHGTGAHPAMTAAGVAAAAAAADGDRELGDDDDLDIGEVSRVVKLADIARAPRSPERAPTSAGSKPGAASRLSGAHPGLRGTAAHTSLPLGALADGAVAPLSEVDAARAMAPVHRAHRRSLIALLSVAGVMVLGVIGAVVLFATTDDDSLGGRLGSVRGIDTLRPDDPITQRPIAPGTLNPPTHPIVPRPNHGPRPNPPQPPVGSARDPDPPPGNALRFEEVEDAARKHQDMTQRCYMRAQRGADSIIVGDVKKITVTLTIDPEGGVRDVQLSDHAGDNLGKCLIGSMKGWKFRASSGGIFRFSLNFAGG
jgi:predicted Zn finger-like uncharacterized protein